MSNGNRLTWAAISGTWSFPESGVEYTGPEDASQPVGVALSSRRLRNGRMSASIRLRNPAEDAGRLLLGYNTVTGGYYSAGLGGYGRAYVGDDFPAGNVGSPITCTARGKLRGAPELAGDGAETAPIGRTSAISTAVRHVLGRVRPRPDAARLLPRTATGRGQAVRRTADRLADLPLRVDRAGAVVGVVGTPGVGCRLGRLPALERPWDGHVSPLPEEGIFRACVQGGGAENVSSPSRAGVQCRAGSTASSTAASVPGPAGPSQAAPGTSGWTPPRGAAT